MHRAGRKPWAQSGGNPEHSQVRLQSKQTKITDADYTHLGKFQVRSDYFTNESSLKWLEGTENMAIIVDMVKAERPCSGAWWTVGTGGGFVGPITVTNL